LRGGERNAFNKTTKGSLGRQEKVDPRRKKSAIDHGRAGKRELHATTHRRKEKEAKVESVRIRMGVDQKYKDVVFSGQEDSGG